MAVSEMTRAVCTGVKLVSDPRLDRLHRVVSRLALTRVLEIPAGGSPGALSGKGPQAADEEAPRPTPESCPFDLEVPPPYAVDLRRLCDLTRTKVPPEVEAKLGPNTPVLLYHRMTPFARPGEKAPRVWGMGYTVRLKGLPAAATIDLVPNNRLATLAAASTELSVGLGAGGDIGLPAIAGQAIGAAVPGWSVKEAKLSVSADARSAFVLSLDFDVSLLEVQAGPVGAGGARWNLYRHGQRLDVTQSLAHTVAVPKGTPSLKLAVTVWVRESGFLGGPARQWSFAPQRFEVPLSAAEAATLPEGPRQ